MNEKKESFTGLSINELDLKLHTLGVALTEVSDQVRFDGVLENLLREVRSGLCTAQQAIAYAANFVAWLQLEHEAWKVKMTAA